MNLNTIFTQASLLHGGVHTILLDKVKKESINLTGDYIVRVTGRASPYNINRLTFYTKNGNIMDSLEKKVLTLYLIIALMIISLILLFT